jgi:hypothetical protein
MGYGMVKANYRKNTKKCKKGPTLQSEAILQPAVIKEVFVGAPVESLYVLSKST